MKAALPQAQAHVNVTCAWDGGACGRRSGKRACKRADDLAQRPMCPLLAAGATARGGGRVKTGSPPAVSTSTNPIYRRGEQEPALCVYILNPKGPTSAEARVEPWSARSPLLTVH